MEFLEGMKDKDFIEVFDLFNGSHVGETVKLRGMVHVIRHMGEVSFVILRRAQGLLQCVYEQDSMTFSIKDLKEESAVEVSGVVVLENGLLAKLRFG